MADAVQFAPGMKMPVFSRPPIDHGDLLSYAQASGDFNPIHLDDEAARRAGLKCAIAHGAYSMAFIAQAITTWFGPASVQLLEVRFRRPVFVGDVLICHGEVAALEGVADARDESIRLAVWAENDRGERVIEGWASAKLLREC